MGRSASVLIEELGGRSVVSDRTGTKPGTVDVWKHRNRIPRTAWPEIQKAFPNVTLDQLLETEAAAPPRAPTGDAPELAA